MADSRPASVTLRDLADDLAYFVGVLESTRQSGDREVAATAIQGLRSLHEVIEAYAGGGFRIEPGEPDTPGWSKFVDKDVS